MAIRDVMIVALFTIAIDFWNTAKAQGPKESGNLKLTVSVVGDQPLPYQAVRLRCEFMNTSQQPVTKTWSLGNDIQIVRIKKEGEEESTEGTIVKLTALREIRGPICSPPTSQAVEASPR